MSGPPGESDRLTRRASPIADYFAPARLRGRGRAATGLRASLCVETDVVLRSELRGYPVSRPVAREGDVAREPASEASK